MYLQLQTMEAAQLTDNNSVSTGLPDPSRFMQQLGKNLGIEWKGQWRYVQWVNEGRYK